MHEDEWATLRAKLLPKYRVILASLLESLARACAGPHDFKGIATVGHQLKGNGSMYGFPELTKLGAELEVAAGREDIGGIDQLNQKIRAFVSRHDLRIS